MQVWTSLLVECITNLSEWFPLNKKLGCFVESSFKFSLWNNLFWFQGEIIW